MGATIDKAKSRIKQAVGDLTLTDPLVFRRSPLEIREGGDQFAAPCESRRRRSMPRRSASS
jgi:hypothetical protein